MAKEGTEIRKPNSAIIMSSRIRLARNLAGERFANSASAKSLESVFEKCANAFSEIKKLKGGTLYKISDLSDFSRAMLVENRAISKELVDGGLGKGAFVSKDGGTSALINEEDHLRIQMISKDRTLASIWKSINALDDSIEERLEYAFSTEYGYLTACPTNVGTGMRASLMMHLPALSYAGQMDKITCGVNQIGMVVRGANGEGSDSFGSIFQVSNQQTLGMAEGDIVKRIQKFGKMIAQFEANARLKLMEDKPLLLPDKFARSLAVLRNCKLIDTAEAITCLSNLRLAADMGFMDGGDEFIEEIDELITNVMPSHLLLNSGVYDASPEMRDVLRAQTLNAKSAKFPPLRFSKASK